MVKEEIRILGIDDGPFTNNDKEVIVVGVIFRGGNFLDGVLRTYVVVDGLDATEKLSKMINSSRHKNQLKVIMLDGITLGGFNIVDLKELYNETKIPIIVINRRMPDLKSIKKALEKNFLDFEKRWKMILNAGKIKQLKLEKFSIYYQNIGLEDEEAEEIIILSTKHAQIPEPLRVAHLIASGIVKGESEGHA
ncbi:MAG: DUF99 family protein [Candidatus Aenigmarchaeota archaeon]|jgi:endonuclease V-like protein UPF0215 family|nr:DUF99 family protein [Candidatus Aenigmarchaeota archaeon]